MRVGRSSLKESCGKIAAASTSLLFGKIISQSRPLHRKRKRCCLPVPEVPQNKLKIVSLTFHKILQKVPKFSYPANKARMNTYNRVWLDATVYFQTYLVVASFSPFFQSHTTMTWLSSSPTLANFFPSPRTRVEFQKNGCAPKPLN